MSKNIVSVTVNGRKTNALRDTGASISCISKTFFDKGFNDVYTKCTKSNISTIVGVGGTQHAVQSETNVDICFGSLTLNAKFYVIEDLHHSIILGIDFMEKHRVTLDISANKFIIEGSTKVCTITTYAGVARTVRSTAIDQQSEVTVPVKISRVQSGTEVLLEPLSSLPNKNIIGAKSLVVVRNHKAVMRVLNPTNKTVNLKSYKSLANVVLIEPASVLSIDEIAEECQNENTVGLSDLQNKSKTCHTPSFDLSNSDMSAEQKEKLLHLLEENRDVFSEGLHDLGCTNLQTHRIETGDAPPVRLPPYQQNPNVREATREWAEKMSENRIIEPSMSNWHSPVVLVKKADSNEYRFAVDYRKLNKISKPQAYPLPKLTDIFDAIGESNAQFFFVA